MTESKKPAALRELERQTQLLDKINKKLTLIKIAAIIFLIQVFFQVLALGFGAYKTATIFSSLNKKSEVAVESTPIVVGTILGDD